MERVLGIAYHELIANLKRRSFLLMTWGVPLLAFAIVLGSTLFEGGEKDEETPLADLEASSIGYVDHSELFQNPGAFAAILVPYPDEAAATAAVEAGDLRSYYVIPADYMETGDIRRVSLEFSLAETDMGLFQSFLVTTMLEDDSPLVLARLESPAQVVEHQLDRSGELIAEIEGSGFDRFWLVYAFAMIMMMTTFFSASQLMRSVILEKENRMIEIVLSSLRPMQLLAGKILGQGTAGLLQIIVWLGSVLVIIQLTDANIPFLGQADVPSNMYVVAVLYYLGGYLLFSCFAAGIGAISANLREGPQYAIVYSLPAVAPLMVLANTLNAPNGTLAVVMSMFPLCSPLGMIQRMVLTAVPAWQIALSLALLFASIAGGLWAASRLFKVNTLLSGQLPSRKQLIQMLIRG